MEYTEMIDKVKALAVQNRAAQTEEEKDEVRRQMNILKGMVDGKTNHDLATQLGYSVSTIRHETMRIYQALAVSDRREAAQRALEYGWI